MLLTVIALSLASGSWRACWSAETGTSDGRSLYLSLLIPKLMALPAFLKKLGFEECGGGGGRFGLSQGLCGGDVTFLSDLASMDDGMVEELLRREEPALSY